MVTNALDNFKLHRYHCNGLETPGLIPSDDSRVKSCGKCFFMLSGDTDYDGSTTIYRKATSRVIRNQATSSTTFAGTMVLRGNISGFESRLESLKSNRHWNWSGQWSLAVGSQKNDSTAKRSRNRKRRLYKRNQSHGAKSKIRRQLSKQTLIWNKYRLIFRWVPRHFVKCHKLQRWASFFFLSTFSLVMPSLAPRLKNMTAALRTSFLQMMVLAQSS